MRLCALAATAAFIAGTAHASIIYNWQPVSPGTSSRLPGETQFTTTGGQLIFADGALDATLNYDGPFDGYSSYSPDPSSPILSVALNSPDFADFYLAPRTTSGLPWLIQSRITSVGSFLTGNLGVINFETDFTMASTGRDGLWAFDAVNSDAGNPCSLTGACTGGTGRWVLASSSVSDVPAPTGLYLLGLALIGGLYWRRAARLA